MSDVKKKQVPIHTRFLLGGIAGCSATCCVHPLDVTRVQMQLDAEGGGKRLYNGTMDCMTGIYKKTLVVKRGGHRPGHDSSCTVMARELQKKRLEDNTCVAQS